MSQVNLDSATNTYSNLNQTFSARRNQEEEFEDGTVPRWTDHQNLKAMNNFKRQGMMINEIVRDAIQSDEDISAETTVIKGNFKR